MSISNPAQLVAEFKGSGQFDRMRREMLAEFQKSDRVIPLMTRVEDIARQKFTSDKKLEYMQQEAVHRELMDELNRYPVVERAVGDFRSQSDASFSKAAHDSLRTILQRSRGEVPEAAVKPNGTVEPILTDTVIEKVPAKTEQPPIGGAEQLDKMDTEAFSKEEAAAVEKVAAHPITEPDAQLQ